MAIWLCQSPSFAQSCLLRPVPPMQMAASLRSVMDTLEQSCGVSFAYNNDWLNDQKTVEIYVHDQLLGELLNEIIDTHFLNIVESDCQILFLKKEAILPVIGTVQPSIRNWQRYTISGIVRDKGSKETLLGAHVFARELRAATNTDQDGYYSMSLRPGIYSLRFSYVGYHTLDTIVHLHTSRRMNIDLEMLTYALSPVIKDENAEDVSEYVYMSKVEIPKTDIEMVPTLLGEQDMFRALQLMPGIQGGREGQGGLYVRGGTSDQNLILLDGIPMYRPQHLLGAISALDGQLFKNVELLKAGIPARYGGRLSGVMDLTMREGNKKKMQKDFKMGLLSVGSSVEIPLQKEKSSLLINGRRFFWDLIYPFLDNGRENGGVDNYYFHDVFGKYDLDIDNDNRISVTSFWSADFAGSNTVISRTYSDSDTSYNYTDENNIRLRWGNTGAGAKWRHIYSDKAILFAGIHYSLYRFQNAIATTQTGREQQRETNKLQNSIQDAGVSLEVSYFPNLRTNMRYGVLGTVRAFAPQLVTRSRGKDVVEIPNQLERSTAFENAIYGELTHRWQVSFRTQAGLRLEHYSKQGFTQWSLQPRVLCSWQPSSTLTLKTSYAFTRQNIHLIGNSGIQLPTDLWLTADEELLPQSAHQLACGAVLQLSDQYDWITEIYYKKFDNILNLLPGYSYTALFADRIDPYVDKTGLTNGQGNSRGLETMLRKRHGKLRGWVSYSLLWTQYNFPEIANQTFFADHDQRHNFSITSTYALSDFWQASLSWVLASGSPYTLPTAKYRVYDPQTGATDWVWIADQKNNVRGRMYHRLDVSMQYTKRKVHTEQVWTFGLFNAYARSNPFFYDVRYLETPDGDELSVHEISIFPLLPSISYKLAFM